MTHKSEAYEKLELIDSKIERLTQLRQVNNESPAVYLFWLPHGRTNSDAVNSDQAFAKIVRYCSQLHQDSTVCVLTTPPDAAILLSTLEESLKYRFWAVVKTASTAGGRQGGQLPNSHVALLVLTRYDGTLRHSITRVQYTYCPACGRTTKDYGGKKHMHHEYGTLLSDVWRDIICDPSEDIDSVVDRLRDLFGVDLYHNLYRIDLRECLDFSSPEYGVKNETRPVTRLTINTQRRDVLPVDVHINADCLKALRELPDDSVDFCFADLPYNLNKKYYRSKDDLDTVSYFRWCNKWLSELHRVLKPGRTLVVLNIPLWSARHHKFLSSIMSFQAWIAWDEIGFPVRKIMPAHYSIICFTKGEPRPLPGLNAAEVEESERRYLTPLADRYCSRKKCVADRQGSEIVDTTNIIDLWHDIHRLKHNSNRVDHPCQLPPMLMHRLFALFTIQGEIILDCFNGAGTSTLVARQMNRRFIGIELSTRYHKMALQRHEQLANGMDPFATRTNGVPKAKNNRVQRLVRRNYPVTKKELQLDVKRIADELGRVPNRKDVEEHGKHPFQYFREFFINWGEVCAAARTTGMTELPLLLKDDVGECVDA